MKKSEKLVAVAYMISTILGIAIIIVGVKLSMPLPDGFRLSPGPLAYFLLAALTGLLARGLMRKLFFRSHVTLHQSFSFECVIETARLINPFMSKISTESEFIKRETSMGTEAYDWIVAKFTAGLITPILTIVIAYAVRQNIFNALTALLFSVMLLAFATIFTRRTSLLCLGYAAVMCLEGGIFIFALKDSMPILDGIIIYSLFTLLLGNSVIPFALGFAELAAAPFIAIIPGIFLYVIVFHIFRIVPELSLGCTYLARYKFKIRDFFMPELSSVLRSSRRPAVGWDPFPHKGEIRASIVIPAYNEEKRIPEFLSDVRNYMDGKTEKFEVVIVDDGSRDNTAEVVEKLASEDPRIRLIRQIPNQGKGAAVKRGVLEAKGDFVIFADADGATPITELDKFLPIANLGDDILVGSRKAGSGSVERNRNLIRSIMGFIFYKIVNFFAVPAVKDTQCGFKLFRKDVALKLFSSCAEKGWAFDVELLYLAQLHGFKITEVPVNWHEVEGSKVNPLKDSIKMFIAIFRIRKRHSGFTHEHGEI